MTAATAAYAAPCSSHAPAPPLRRAWRALTALLLASACGAIAPAAQAAGDPEFLPVEQVFRYSASADARGVTVAWTVAPGYYLYKGRMSFTARGAGYALGAPAWPVAGIHQDEYFGRQEIFRGAFRVTIPFSSRAAAGGPLDLQLKLQGCADAGLCYPPQTWTTRVNVPAATASAAPAPAAPASAVASTDAPSAGFAAATGGARRVTQDAEFLPVDQAFRLDAIADGPDAVRLVWEIEPGYYLYKARIKAVALPASASAAPLVLPQGLPHEDEYFGSQEIYREELVARLPLTQVSPGRATVPVEVSYQGCADAGLCYPPQTRRLEVRLPAAGTASSSGPASGADAGLGAAGTTAVASAAPGTGNAAPFLSEQDRLAALIRSGNIFLVLGTFFAIGLGLAFTPCVLPMVPILSSLIAGQGSSASPRRSFMLSLAYVLGMAFTYTVAGVLAALAGAHVQAMFQQTWIIVLFGGLFVVLALSMFGLFTLQMPAAIQTRLSDTSNRQRAGTLGGVAIMGALSALIVTACVAPALVAALAVIGQSGNVLRGGLALFIMSLGMGAPLLAVGASAGKLLPRAGAWMDTVKRFFGVMMLGVAVWMFARLVPDRVALLLWAVPAVIAAWLLWTAVRNRSSGSFWPLRAAATAAGAYGMALLLGSALGGTDPLAPIPQLAARHADLAFRRIKTVDDLDAAVAAAAQEGRPVMLDFYADWCASCKEMEKYTFSDAGVQRALGSFVLLRADVTANDALDQALLNRFGIVGPPTIAFYGTDGHERRNYRVVGYMKAPQFAAVAHDAVQAGAASVTSRAPRVVVPVVASTSTP